MCTYVTTRAAVAGSACGGEEWFGVDRTVVYFDHPQDAPIDHALCVDVWGGNRRIALELDVPSARALATAILETLEHDEVKALA